MSSYQFNCPVCLNAAMHHRGDVLTRIQCERCGIFDIASRLEPGTHHLQLNDRQRANASAWLYYNPLAQITSEPERDRLFSHDPPSVTRRLDLLLQYIARNATALGPVPAREQKVISATWSLNEGEVRALKELLIEQGKLKSSADFEISAKGWEHLDAIGNGVGSNLCFVAMWFDKSMDEVYNQAIEPGIRAAGYEPRRVDRVRHNEKICDKIVTLIRQSKFVVADYTGHNPGVYYEAGFAHGLGKQVIWTKSDEEQKPHFDVRQYAYLPWKRNELPSLREELALKILAVMGPGANPVDEKLLGLA